MKSKTSSSGYFKSSRTVLYGRVWVPVAPFCFSPYTTDVLFKELATSGLTRRPTPHTFLKLNKRLFMLPHVTQSLSGPCRRKMLRDPQARYPTPLQSIRMPQNTYIHLATATLGSDFGRQDWAVLAKMIFARKTCCRSISRYSSTPFQPAQSPAASSIARACSYRGSARVGWIHVGPADYVK